MRFLNKLRNVALRVLRKGAGVQTLLIIPVETGRTRAFVGAGRVHTLGFFTWWLKKANLVGI